MSAPRKWERVIETVSAYMIVFIGNVQIVELHAMYEEHGQQNRLMLTICHQV